MSKFCSSCGFRLSDTATYCPNCGKSVKSVESVESVNTQKSPSFQASQQDLTSIDDCTKKDQTAYTLFYIEDSLVRWGKILGLIIVVIGIVGIISSTILQIQAKVNGWEIFFSIIWDLALSVLKGVLTYYGFFLLSVLFSSLGKLVQNTKNTACLLEWQTRQLSQQAQQNDNNN